jgi:hypothetical protein
MAVATVPTLGATTLPVPKEQSYTLTYRGGTLAMADGSIVHDLVDATARHLFRLRWELLTATELATVKTAYAGVKDATASYKSIENVTYTVTRPDGGEMTVDPVVTAAGDVKFNVTIELIEDS